MTSEDRSSTDYLLTPKGKVMLDRDGFLVRPEDWSEEVARMLAEAAGLKEMTAQHQDVMTAMRDYYFSRGRAPTGSELKTATGLSLLSIKTLFPGGIKFGARRLAGIPNPKTCSSQ